jgi:hypothetical protein
LKMNNVLCCLFGGELAQLSAVIAFYNCRSNGEK